MKASVPAISPSYGMWVLTKTKSLDSSIVLNSATVMSVNPFAEPAPWQPDRSRSVPVVSASNHLRMVSLQSRAKRPARIQNQNLSFPDRHSSDRTAAIHLYQKVFTILGKDQRYNGTSRSGCSLNALNNCVFCQRPAALWHFCTIKIRHFGSRPFNLIENPLWG